MEDSPIPDISGKDANDGAGTSPRSQGKAFRYLCNALKTVLNSKINSEQLLIDLGWLRPALLSMLQVNLIFLFSSTFLCVFSPPAFLTHVLWRPGSKKSWWPRVCWILRSGLDQGETLRTKSWLSCRRGKQS